MIGIRLMLYSKNDFNRKDILFISIIYFLLVASYIDTSTIIKFGIVLLSLIYQLLSLRSIAILILALFIPFISGYIGRYFET